MLYLNYQFQTEAYVQSNLIYMANDNMENHHDFLR